MAVQPVLTPCGTARRRLAGGVTLIVTVIGLLSTSIAQVIACSSDNYYISAGNSKRYDEPSCTLACGMEMAQPSLCRSPTLWSSNLQPTDRRTCLSATQPGSCLV